jgi:lipopolysaccharide biosynthesis regulator YciM
MPTCSYYDFNFDDDYNILNDLVNSNYNEAVAKLLQLVTHQRPTVTLSKIYCNIATLYLILNNYNAMEEYANKAIALGCVKTIHLLGKYYQKIKNTADAIKQYGVASNLGYVPSLTNLALFHKIQEDYDEMKICLNKAIESKSQLANIIFGDYYLKKKNYQKAYHYYKQCEAVSPKMAYYSLAQYNKKIKNIKLMKYYYNKGIENNDPQCSYGYAMYFKKFNGINNTVKYLNIAMQLGCITSIYELAKYYKKWSNDVEYVEYLKLCANLDYLPAMISFAKYQQKNQVATKEIALLLSKILDALNCGCKYRVLCDNCAIIQVLNLKNISSEPINILGTEITLKNILKFY